MKIRSFIVIAAMIILSACAAADQTDQSGGAGNQQGSEKEEMRDKVIEFYVRKRASVDKINENLFMMKLPELGNRSKK